MVRTGRTDALPELEQTLVSLHLAILANRPWPAPSALAQDSRRRLRDVRERGT
jgi:hypothetical protein